MVLNFVNDTTGAALEAEIEQDMTADEIIANLINEELISQPQPGHNWALFQSGKSKISGSKTIGESDFVDGDTVQLVQIGTA